MRDVFHVSVVLDGLKTRKEFFEMHHGERKNRRGWCISNHGPTSNSSTMATFLVVHHAHGQQVQPHNRHAHFHHLQVAVGECLYRFLNVCHLRLDYIDSR
jgi:hypothetical protein